VCFQSSFESAQSARITDGSRYIVPDSRCRMLVEVMAVPGILELLVASK